MKPKTIYATSREDVLIPIEVEQGGLPVDPTGDVVQAAFIPVSQAEPAPGDWVAADWETDLGGSAPEYLVRCLVGPGGTVVLAAGTYQPFARVFDGTEQPVLRSPRLLTVV